MYRSRFRFRGARISACRRINPGQGPAQHAVEEFRFLLEIAADRLRHQVVTSECIRQFWPIPIEKDQPLRVGDRQRAQNNLIDQRIDRRTRADSQRQ